MIYAFDPVKNPKLSRDHIFDYTDKTFKILRIAGGDLGGHTATVIAKTRDFSAFLAARRLLENGGP